MSSEGSATAAGARPDGTASDATKPSDDPQVLREEIERTREQLGQTVEALAAKADVKAQAQQKLSQLTARLKTTVSQARQQGAATAAATISKVTPEPVQRAAGNAADTARRHRGPLAAAAGAIGAAVLALLLILRRRRR